METEGPQRDQDHGKVLVGQAKHPLSVLTCDEGAELTWDVLKWDEQAQSTWNLPLVTNEQSPRGMC